MSLNSRCRLRAITLMVIALSAFLSSAIQAHAQDKDVFPCTFNDLPHYGQVVIILRIDCQGPELLEPIYQLFIRTAMQVANSKGPAYIEWINRSTQSHSLKETIKAGTCCNADGTVLYYNRIEMPFLGEDVPQEIVNACNEAINTYINSKASQYNATVFRFEVSFRKEAIA